MRGMALQEVASGNKASRRRDTGEERSRFVTTTRFPIDCRIGQGCLIGIHQMCYHLPC